MYRKRLIVLVLLISVLVPIIEGKAQGDLTISLNRITTTSDEITISGNQIIYANTNAASVSIHCDCTGDIAMVNASRIFMFQAPQEPNAPYILTYNIDPSYTEEGTLEIRVWDKAQDYQSITVEFINNRGGSAQTNTNSESQSSNDNTDHGDSSNESFSFTIPNIGGLLTPIYTFINYLLIGSGLTTGWILTNLGKEYLEKKFLRDS